MSLPFKSNQSHVSSSSKGEKKNRTETDFSKNNRGADKVDKKEMSFAYIQICTKYFYVGFICYGNL